MHEGLLGFLLILVQVFLSSGVEVPPSLTSVDSSVLLTGVLVCHVVFVTTSTTSTRLFADWTVFFNAAWGPRRVRFLKLVYYLPSSSLHNLECQSWNSLRLCDGPEVWLPPLKLEKLIGLEISASMVWKWIGDHQNELWK